MHFIVFTPIQLLSQTDWDNYSIHQTISSHISPSRARRYVRVLQDLCFFTVTSVTPRPYASLKTEQIIAFKRRIRDKIIGRKANFVPNTPINHSFITSYQ